ncbi:hypothetical protein FB45DRAFT_734075 [Roridomyces roridus]|uniref:RNA-binding protein VTS1 n=1 Tax=Roridomyces roridus TaxID=1738132 RepID=A0AAD7G088_9AGAR|nr:hypothetical protein FB45DRAFT_734075 [Roridomyces roridus]
MQYACHVLLTAQTFVGEGLDQWFEDLSKYEVTLVAMAQASTEPKFKDELGTIEQWFKVLSEAERTAAMYTLLQHSNPNQIRFFIAVLQQMAGPAGTNGPIDGSFKAKQASHSGGLRPPNLNIGLPASPATPHFNTPLSAEGNGQDVVINRPDEGSWANMVNTPLVPMFQKAAGKKNVEQNTNMGMLSPGMFPPGMINPLMLNNMALANEAQLSQLLQLQMMMGGMVPPGIQVPPTPKSGKQQSNNWRSPTGNRYPGSPLRSKNGAGKSSSTSGGATTAREDDIDPKLLEDIPAWLRTLRLHKYTECFKGLTWKEMVLLDEPTLEAKGVAALGARRRLIKTFDLVKKKMGMETETSEPPPEA